MRKLTLIVLGIALAAIATTGGAVGGPGPGATSTGFEATIGGVEVDITLPNADWSKGAVSPGSFTINGPSGVTITCTPLSAAKGLGKNDMDALCQEKLAEKAKAVTTGTKVVVTKNTSGVTYALRLHESGGQVYFVGVSGTGSGGVMFYAKVSTAQKNTVKNALKSILNDLALSK
ncbi:hypothetical protein KAU45_09110 [bacterium]|nr:hypothetical protein [bacterium]